MPTVFFSAAPFESSASDTISTSPVAPMPIHSAKAKNDAT